MRNMLLAVSGLLSIAALGCAAPVDESASAQQGEAVEACSSAPAYYIVTHVDTRKCAYPMCGGYFVKQVNQDLTRCADGVMAPECHVVNVDLGALALPDADATKFVEIYGEGHGLVRGNLAQFPVGFYTGAKLVADEAWVPMAITNPTGSFYFVEGTGVRCFAAPCPSFTEEKLNTGSTHTLAGVDLAASGANSKQVAFGLSLAEGGGGILVAGHHTNVTGPAGTMKQLVASEFYTRIVPSPAN